MKDREMMANYMTALGELFDKSISKSLMHAYWTVLEPYGDDEVEKAFKQLIRTAKFFPKPVEIIEAMQGPQGDQAVLAWQKVDRAVRDHGPYASVTFDDPVIHSTLELMGGWARFQDCALKDWPWRQKEFERLYGVLSRRGDHPEYLPGLAEIDNQGRGYGEHTPRPVQIGDRGPRLRLVEGNDTKWRVCATTENQTRGGKCHGKGN